MKSDELIQAIEAIADPALQAEWDKSGIQVAASRPEVFRLGIFLDPTPGQVERALEAGCDFLLCHHPLALKPRLPSKLDAYYDVLKFLMRANVCLYAAHTSLDVNIDGPAGWLGRELGLQHIQPLEKLPERPDLGYGVVGALPERALGAGLISRILGLLNLECGNICGAPLPETCEVVAICGGSGSSLIGKAHACGAGLYVTGDIKYHDALDAEIPILDVGHHSLEEEMMRRLALHFSRNIADISVEFFPSRSPFRRACQ